DLYSGTVDKDGVIHKTPDIAEMRKNLYSVSISDKKTVNTMRNIYKKYKILLEPHGAVGVAALEMYLKKNKKTTSICLETADPAKFPEIIIRELGIRPKAPTSFKIMEKRKSSHDTIDNNYVELKEYLVKQWNG
ncbi:threonine synthase, partial [Candidatus Woesearchaeota archaeon]|nr:threonine synthase [Candidatus Woesearchaeota archaeon]